MNHNVFAAMRANRALTYACTGTAAGIFGLWSYSSRGVVYRATQSLPRLPGLKAPSPEAFSKILNDTFILKASEPDNYPAWIGAAFSHKDPLHLAFNLITFSSFAKILWYLPPYHFATIIFGSAIAASGTWLFEQCSISQRQFKNNQALGSSGIVSGVLTSVTMFAPTLRVSIMGVIPVPLWSMTLGYFALDTYAMNRAPESPIGHSAHIGGSLFGISYYVLFLRRFGGILGR